jgi:hypothetical protein
MTPKIDFQLVEVFPDGRVTGRNCGADTPAGTVFSGLYRRDFPVREPDEEIVSPDLVFVCEVSLRLEAIEMYQRPMDSVASGHTAMLSLSGDEFPTVAQYVSTASERTYYSLCVFDESLPNVHNA